MTNKKIGVSIANYDTQKLIQEVSMGKNRLALLLGSILLALTLVMPPVIAGCGETAAPGETG